MCQSRVKVAVQRRAAFIVTFASLQSASPLHPLKRQLAAGVAVSVTARPGV